eukprot:5694169-Amphidinium_carterae.1
MSGMRNWRDTFCSKSMNTSQPTVDPVQAHCSTLQERGNCRHWPTLPFAMSTWNCSEFNASRQIVRFSCHSERW